MAVKVESVPSLDTKWLSLKDQACKPQHGDDRFAFFTFTVDSCGTTRRVSSRVVFLKKIFLLCFKIFIQNSLTFQFSEDYIIYENQIAQNYNPRKGPTFAAPVDSKYK